MKNQAKPLYISGQSIAQIATTLGFSRATVYNWKNADKAAGVDWDELRFLKATDASEAQRNEEDFVALLIHQFESALEKLNGLDPEQQVKTLSQYIATYYKLKQQRANPKVSKAEVAKRVLQEISAIALAKEATAVIHFLSDHADEIVTTVIQ